MRRRKSSSRRGSDAPCTLEAAASEGAVSQALAAALSRFRSAPKRLASASKKAMRGPVRQFRVAREEFARERHAGGFAATGEEILAELRQAFRALLGDAAPVARAVDERAAALGDRLQHVAEGGGAHGG